MKWIGAVNHKDIAGIVVVGSFDALVFGEQKDGE